MRRPIGEIFIFIDIYKIELDSRFDKEVIDLSIILIDQKCIFHWSINIKIPI